MRGGPYQLAPTVLEVLCQYNWKDGNIRELRNCLRAMTEKSINRVLTPNSIPDHIWEAIDNGATARDRGTHQSIVVTWRGQERPSFDALSDKLLTEIIRQEFRANGKMSMRGAAKAAGVAKSSMSAKLRHLVQSGALDEDELAKMILTQEDA
jgi:DNA-binding NtrC family response regulator